MPSPFFKFLNANNLIGSTRMDTINRILTWCRNNLSHQYGEYAPKFTAEKLYLSHADDVQTSYSRNLAYLTTEFLITEATIPRVVSVKQRSRILQYERWTPHR